MHLNLNFHAYTKERKAKQLAIAFMAQKTGRAQHMEIEQRRVRVAGSLDQIPDKLVPK